MQSTKAQIEVKDGSLIARVLDPHNQNELAEALTFRHKIFLEELGWSLLESNGQESDEYDKNSIHFGAFEDSGQMVGYCRLIPSINGFLLENEFADLVYPGYRFRKEKDTVEISRFAITRERRGKVAGFRVISVLLISVYQWAKANDVHYIYGVCASDTLGHVRESLLGAKRIGPDHEYQPGIFSAAFIIDLDKLDVTRIMNCWSRIVKKPQYFI